MTKKGTRWSRNEEGTGPATFHRQKPCVKCGSHEFLVSNSRCRPCNNRYGMQNRMATPERDAMRGEPCEICAEAMEQPCFDEVDGELRGWLCQHCNRGLGHFRENATLLRRAFSYVMRTRG